MNAIPLVLLGLGLEVCCLSLPWTGGDRLASTVAILILSFLFYILAYYRYQPPSGAGGSRPWVIAFALLFRLTLWPAEPRLSEDLYRYRWEARVQAEGGNPYLARPNDAEWASLRDETSPRIPAPDFRAGYGPLLELAQRCSFAVARAVSADPATQTLWMKLPAALGDLGVLALLGRHPLLIVYAWNPLVLSEFAWSGHNDALVAFAVLAAWRRRSFGALGAAVALKWWPLALAPALLRHVPWTRALAIPAILALAAIPFIPPEPAELIENARFMSGFAGGWRNNDSLFGAVLWLAGGDMQTAKYATFALMAAAVLGFARWPLERAWTATTAAILLLAANCHPWYVCWLVPLLAIGTPWPPLLLWTGLAPLSYSVLVKWRVLGEWDGSTPERWWIYAPVFAAMAAWRVFAAKLH